MTRVRGLALILAAVFVTSMTCSTAALAVGEQETDYLTPESISSHFYDIGITKVPTVVGTPYLTAVSSTSVLSLDWDYELALTDVVSRSSQDLGTLPIPAGSRVLDFQYFDEWKATATTFPAFVSYSLYDAVTNCHRMYLRQATVDSTGGGANSLGKVWFTSACFPKAEDDPYILAQSGGRMALVPKGMRTSPAKPEFYLGIGDFRIAKPYDIKLSPAARNTLSTIVRIPEPGTYAVWTRGVRNPQGLVVATVDGRKEVLGTSQGPRGGDEFYVAAKGADYGWPHRSYGTAYFPGDPAGTPDVEGTKRGYDEPLFVWTPSIGLSTMMQLQGPAFQQWWGAPRGKGTPDLILSGMGARWLYRVHMSQGAVRGYEGLYIGARARSLAQLPNGYIVVGLDGGKELLVLQPTAAWSSQAESKVPVG